MLILLVLVVEIDKGVPVSIRFVLVWYQSYYSYTFPPAISGICNKNSMRKNPSDMINVEKHGNLPPFRKRWSFLLQLRRVVLYKKILHTLNYVAVKVGGFSLLIHSSAYSLFADIHSLYKGQLFPFVSFNKTHSLGRT